MIEFRKITDFPRGTLHRQLTDAYSFDKNCYSSWHDDWKTYDDFFYDNPYIAENFGFITVLDGTPIGHISWDPRKRPDYVIIGEATNLALKIGQRGRGEIVLETIGKPAHSANPEKGINAVKKMMKLVAALEDIVPDEQPNLGKGIMELTDIVSAPFPGASVVPERCIATLDRRLLVGDTKDSVLDPIRQRIDLLSSQDPQFHAKVYFRSETKLCPF